MKKTILPLLAAVIFCIQNLPAAAAPEISAEYACVMLADSGRVIYEKNAYARHSMASTTKIMTALLALENCELDAVVSVSRNAALQEGSSMYLRPGNQITMENLLYGLMLNSGNDAAVAIAEYIAGDTESFAKQMTARAKKLGAKDTQFQNPNGLDADGHYTTAYDLALITRAAMQNEIFREIVSTKIKTVPLVAGGAELYLANHNKMLKIYDGADGVKTGFTKATGRCLVSSATRDGVSVIAVTLRAPNDWNDHTQLLDDAFANYTAQTVCKAGECLQETQISGTPVRVLAGAEVQAVCARGEKPRAEIVLHVAEKIDSSLDEEAVIGYAEVKTEGKTQEIPLLCDRQIEYVPTMLEKISAVFLRVLQSWVGI